MEESAELIDIDQSIISSEKVKNMKDIDEIGQKLCPYFPGKPKSFQEEAFTAPVLKFNLKMFKALLSELYRKFNNSVMKEQQNKYTNMLLDAFFVGL